MKMKTGYIDCNDITIFYREIGEGPPLLLLHGGLLIGQANWSTHYDYLSQNFRVIVPDHRGHGRTNNPSERFDYGLLASDIAVFLQKLKLPELPIVMGHSSGGVISMHLSARYPERLKKQILIGSHVNIGVSEKFKEGMREVYFTDDYTKPPSKWTHIRNSPIESLAYWSYHKKLHWYRLLSLAWPMWVKPFDLTDEEYEGISCPTLIIFGTKDQFGSKEDFEATNKKIQGSQIKRLEGENHTFVFDRPAEILRKVMSPFLFPKSSEGGS